MRETILAIGLIMIGQQIAIVLLLWQGELRKWFMMAVSTQAQAIVTEINSIASAVQAKFAAMPTDNTDDLTAIAGAVTALNTVVTNGAAPANPVTPPQ